MTRMEVEGLLGPPVEVSSEFFLEKEWLPESLAAKSDEIACWLKYWNGVDNPYFVALDSNDRVVGKVSMFEGPPWHGKAGLGPRQDSHERE